MTRHRALSESACEHLAAERAREAKEIELIEQTLASGDSFGIAEYALSIGLSDEVPKALYRVWEAGLLSGDALKMAIADAWVHNKSPVRGVLGPGLGERRWLRLFKAAGFISVIVEKQWIHDSEGMSEEVLPTYPLVTERPSGPVTVWRGATVESRGRGMSWSLHRDCAYSFAESLARLCFDAGVFRAVVPPDAVLAAFGDVREQELVVNPNMLRGLVAMDEAVAAGDERDHPVLGRFQASVDDAGRITIARRSWDEN